MSDVSLVIFPVAQLMHICFLASLYISPRPRLGYVIVNKPSTKAAAVTSRLAN